jgi:hypothetical protein
VEGQFALKHITDKLEMYYLVINALSQANVDNGLEIYTV